MLYDAVVIDVIELEGFRRVVARAKVDDHRLFVQGSYLKLGFLSQNCETSFRSFTVSESSTTSITLDFVLHDQLGPAANWHRKIEIGDSFQFKGPGKVSRINLDAEEFYFFGDGTSLPAMRAHMLNIDEGKKISVCFLGCQDVLDSFLKDLSFERAESEDFLAHLKSIDPFEKFLWAAGERNEVLQFKQMLGPQWGKANYSYFSSYWKKGVSDEEHRLEKRREKLSANS